MASTSRAAWDTGPGNSCELLQELGWPERDAELVYSHRFIHLSRSGVVRAEARPLHRVASHMVLLNGYPTVFLDQTRLTPGGESQKETPGEVQGLTAWVSDVLDHDPPYAWASGPRVARVYLTDQAVHEAGLAEGAPWSRGGPYSVIIEQGEFQLWCAAYLPDDRADTVSREQLSLLAAAGLAADDLAGPTGLAGRLLTRWRARERPPFIDLPRPGFGRLHREPAPGDRTRWLKSPALESDEPEPESVRRARDHGRTLLDVPSAFDEHLVVLCESHGGGGDKQLMTLWIVRPDHPHDDVIYHRYPHAYVDHHQAIRTLEIIDIQGWWQSGNGPEYGALLLRAIKKLANELGAVRVWGKLSPIDHARMAEIKGFHQREGFVVEEATQEKWALLNGSPVRPDGRAQCRLGIPGMSRHTPMLTYSLRRVATQRIDLPSRSHITRPQRWPKRLASVWGRQLRRYRIGTCRTTLQVAFDASVVS